MNGDIHRAAYKLRPRDGDAGTVLRSQILLECPHTFLLQQIQFSNPNGELSSK